MHIANEDQGFVAHLSSRRPLLSAQGDVPSWLEFSAPTQRVPASRLEFDRIESDSRDFAGLLETRGIEVPFMMTTD